MNDPFAEVVERSQVANTIQTARQILAEPARPSTPRDAERHLFDQNEYNSRPGSAYSIKSLEVDKMQATRKPAKLPSFDTAVITQRMEKLALLERQAENQPVKVPQPRASSVKKKRRTASQTYEYAEEVDDVDTTEAEEVKEDTKSLASEIQNVTTLLQNLVANEESRILYTTQDLDELCITLMNITQRSIDEKYDCNKMLYQVMMLFTPFAEEPEKAIKLSKYMLQCLTLLNANLKSNNKANPLCTNTLKVLYKYSKEPENDFIFFKEKIPATMHRVLQNIVNCINLDDVHAPFDLLIYVIGLMKNTTISIKVRDLYPTDQTILLLSKMLPMAFQTEVPENYVHNKRAQLLIQIIGVLRNMADSHEALPEFESLFVVERVMATLAIFKGHQELALNCSRFISKVSPYEAICFKLAERDTLDLLIELIRIYIDDAQILERVLFVLANIVAKQPLARDILNEDLVVADVIIHQVIQCHMDDELSKKGYRLLANLALDSSVEVLRPYARAIVELVIESVQREDQDLQYLALSALTNVLYYDFPEDELLDDTLRCEVISKICEFMVQTSSEDISHEAVRCLANLTRHEAVCRFLPQVHLVRACLILLEHPNKNIVYFILGAFINISRKAKDLIYFSEYFEGFIELLEACQLEYIELSTQVAMALANLCTAVKGLVPWTSVAGEENIAKMREIITDNIEACKMLIERGEDHLQEYVDILSNIKIPGPMISCPHPDCGRKFPDEASLGEHITRRH